MRNLNTLWLNARFRRGRHAAATVAAAEVAPRREILTTSLPVMEVAPAHGGMTVTVDQLMALYLGGHSSPLLGDEQLSLHGDLNARYGLGTLMISEQMPASRHPISRNSIFAE
jgi:hypothetical protein